MQTYAFETALFEIILIDITQRGKYARAFNSIIGAWRLCVENLYTNLCEAHPLMASEALSPIVDLWPLLQYKNSNGQA